MIVGGRIHLQRVHFPASYVNLRECSETTEADGYPSGPTTMAEESKITSVL